MYIPKDFACNLRFLGGCMVSLNYWPRGQYTYSAHTRTHVHNTQVALVPISTERLPTSASLLVIFLHRCQAIHHRRRRAIQRPFCVQPPRMHQPWTLCNAPSPYSAVPQRSPPLGFSKFPKKNLKRRHLEQLFRIKKKNGYSFEYFGRLQF